MGISIWQLIIVLVIVLLLFGTKKLRNVGADLGSAIKSFRSAVKEGGEQADAGDKEPARLEQSGGTEVPESTASTTKASTTKERESS